MPGPVGVSDGLRKSRRMANKPPRVVVCNEYSPLRELQGVCLGSDRTFAYVILDILPNVTMRFAPREITSA